MRHRYLYKILSLYLTAAFFLGGCAQDLQTSDTTENNAEIFSKTPSPSASLSPTIPPETFTYEIFEGSAYSMSAETLALMQCLESASGHKMEKYIYVDMDHDGKEEMMGAYIDESHDWSIWYVNSDGSICLPIPGSSQRFDTCSFALLNLPTETHVAVNEVNLMGTNKRYSIYRLTDQELQPLVYDNYGSVRQNTAGDILLNVEDYDAHYDIASEGFIGHTWKDTYLYYENGSYKEYGAIILSETQFLQYDNAAEFLSDIRNEETNDNEIQFSYFLRENGIVHIQCERSTEYGSVDYFYYTLRAEGNHLTGSLESKNDGCLGTSFSWLEVTYPDDEFFP